MVVISHSYNISSSGSIRQIYIGNEWDLDVKLTLKQNNTCVSMRSLNFAFVFTCIKIFS